MSEIKLLKCISEKLCEIANSLATPQVRRDIEVLCDVTVPNSPVPVIVRYEYATDGSVESVNAYNLDLTPYAGSIVGLRACEANQDRYDIEEKSFCVNGAERVRISVYNAETNVTVPVTVGWFDVLGVATAAPVVGDVVTAGACPSRDVIGTLSLCAKETLPGTTPTCVETVTNFNLAVGDLIAVTKIADDGLGNYTYDQELATPALATAFVAFLNLMSADNTRTIEDIGNGTIIFNFWENNVSGITLVSPTTVRLNLHLQPGVTDTPDALIAPCTDPVADAVYQSSAALLSSIYNSFTIGVPQPNENLPIDFVLTNYTQVLTGGAETFIPLQEVKFLETNGTITVQHFLLGTNIPYVPTVGATVEYLLECESEIYYPYAYEACADIASVETPVRVFELRDSTGAVFNRRIELSDGTDVTVTATLVECGTCCDATLLPVNMRCDSYTRSNNTNGWLSGIPSASWNGKKSESTADYDALLNDTFPPLVGAPRGLRYILAVANINGNTSAQGSLIDIPVPTANFETSLANALNATLGANIFVHDGTGWQIQYNTAWTTLEIVIQEYADNHAGGYQDVYFGVGFGVRLYAGVLEDGIGVDPNNIASGNWIPTSNCVAI